VPLVREAVSLFLDLGQLFFEVCSLLFQLVQGSLYRAQLGLCGRARTKHRGESLFESVAGDPVGLLTFRDFSTPLS
jgi:hypothetical protein